MDVCLWNGNKVSAFEYSRKFADETEIRQASCKGELRCIDKECNEIMSFKHGEKREAHFAHRHGHGKCEYEKYVNQSNGIIHKTKEVLYFFLESNGYKVSVDENLIGRHYTPLVVDDEEKNIAVEIATKSFTERQIRETDEMYRNNGIRLMWFVADETVRILSESETYYVKRFMLNTDMLIVVNPYEEEILAAKMSDFQYGEKTVNDVFQCEYIFGKLFVENGSFIVENFERDFLCWQESRQKWYNEKYQRKLVSEEKEKEKKRKLDEILNQRKKEHEQEKEKQRKIRQEKYFAKKQKDYIPIESIELKGGKPVNFTFWNKQKFYENISKLAKEYKSNTSGFNILIRKLFECSDEEYRSFIEIFEEEINKTDGINEDMVFIMETAIIKVGR